MSEVTGEMCFIPGQRNPGKNHLLSMNPLTTRCGNFKPGGHEVAQEGADMCQKCLNMAIGRRIEDRRRPLPNLLPKEKGALS
jgi:hypothetical protein